MSTSRREGLATLFVTIQFLALGLLFLSDLLSNKGSTHEYLLLESMCIGIGSFIILFAAPSLKPSLRISPIPKKDSPLKESGIYKYVRHPMYLGVILIGFGFSAYANNNFTWIVELILILDLNLKARFEDQLLIELHPESLHYQLHTSRIIPCTSQSCRKNCSF